MKQFQRFAKNSFWYLVIMLTGYFYIFVANYVLQGILFWVGLLLWGGFIYWLVSKARQTLRF